MIVFQLTREAPVSFAAKELAGYLEKMTGKVVSVRKMEVFDPYRKGVWIGTTEAFGDAEKLPRKIARPGGPFDDAVYVKAGDGRAIISGPNPRSVLFSAYRWLEEIGCRWLRPGKHGERVPTLKRPLSKRVSVKERPACRHRCVCIEGSCSKEHCRDLVDYAAKRGMNAYFIQFRTAYTFFERWYGHERHKGGKTTEFSQTEAKRCREAVKRQAVKRGMILHTVGHGWTCEPFGIPGLEWKASNTRPPAETRKRLAEVKGKRELWGGIPLNTNLCYSDPETRRIMVDAVADYAATHPLEEIIHVWLADGSNNNCECKQCRPHRPSDLYVRLLNEIDTELTARGLPTRIVFLAYVDLLWAPKKERIENPDRFVLMFAPITRSYSKSFLEDADGKASVPRFRRNKLRFPSSPGVNLRMLKEWSKAFTGDCVDFDYHLWQNGQFYDPGQMRCARILHADVRDLPKMGMNGFISCQVQRVAFPTGLYLHVMAKTLWSGKTSFDKLVDEHFGDLFGKDAPAVRAYLEQLSDLFDPPFLRGEKKSKKDRAAGVKSLAKIPDLVDEFLPLAERNRSDDDPVTATAWRHLVDHGKYAKQYANVCARLFDGDPTARDAFGELDTWMRKNLSRIHPVLDTWLVRAVFRHMLHNEGIPLDEG